MQLGKSVRWQSSFALLLLIGSAAAEQPSVQLHRQSTIRFATIEEGKKALAVEDDFLKSLSRFDLQSRLKTDQPVTQKKFVSFITAEVRSWTPDDVERIRPVIHSIRDRLKTFEIPFPKTILLVKTSGREEGGAAYCRKNAVILSETILRRIGRRLESLLIHELFHILSSHNEELRHKLYAIVGFQPCQPVPFPETLKDRRLTNPDAPVIDHYIRLKNNDNPRNAVPILFASVPSYDPKKGGTFFNYVVFRLMIVEMQDQKMVPKLQDGEPILLEPKKQESFLKQIGGNTNYIYHPDEILADNFVLLATGKEQLKTPRIVEQMKKLLTK